MTILWGLYVGGLAVAIGAFGAHALKPLLDGMGRVETFELAVRYQFYHALALLALAFRWTLFESRLLRYGGLFFLLGILFFSGSLYMLCFTGIRTIRCCDSIRRNIFYYGLDFSCLGVYKK